MRRYNAFEEPGTFLHRLATKPIRPLGDTMRNTSEAMTDAQPIVAQVGDMAVDAFGPAIEAGTTGALKAAGDFLKSSAPGMAAAGGSAGASAGGAIGGALGTIVPGLGNAGLGASGAALGGTLGTALGGAGSTAAGLGADALSMATPALSKMAAPTLKSVGRLGYSNLNNAVDKTATAMGSYDDNPATSRGLRALNNAQNPIAKPSSFSGFGSGTPGAGGTAKPSALSSLAGRAETAPPIDVGAKNIAQPRAGMSSPRGINGMDDSMFAPEFTPAAPQARKPTTGGRSAPAPRRQDWGDAKNSVPSQGLGSSPSAIRKLVMPESAMPDTISSNISSSTPGTAPVPGMPPPAPSSAVNTDLRKLVMAQQTKPFMSGRPETEDSAAARLPDMPMPSQRQPPTLTPTGDAGPRPDVPFTPAQDTAMGALVRGGNTMSGPNLTDPLQDMTFRAEHAIDPVDVAIDTAMGAGMSTLGRLAGRGLAAGARAAGGAALDSRATQTAAKAFDDFAAGNGSIPRPVSMPPQQAPRPVSMPPQGPNGTIPGAQWDAASTMQPGPRPVSMPPQPGGSTIPGAQWDKAATQVPGPRPVSMAPQGGRTMPGSQWDDASTLRPSGGGSTVPGSQWDTGATMRPRGATTIPDLSATVPPPGRAGPLPAQGQIPSLLRRPSGPTQDQMFGQLPPPGPDQGFNLFDVTRWTGRGKGMLDETLRDNPEMMMRMAQDPAYAQQVLDYFEAAGNRTVR